jgi:YggT family protein
VRVLATVAFYALWIFVGLLFIRLIFDWVMVFARSWRPSGLTAATLELTYSATDPPLRALRRVLPPLRLGSFAVDLAYILLFIIAYALISVVGRYT